MTATRATKLTAEQLSVFQTNVTHDIQPTVSDVRLLLAHIAALEGELAAVMEQRDLYAGGFERIEGERDALQAALREAVRYLVQRQPMITYTWSKPTARVLKELGL
jgi:hypothetical protein